MINYFIFFNNYIQIKNSLAIGSIIFFFKFTIIVLQFCIEITTFKTLGYYIQEILVKIKKIIM